MPTAMVSAISIMALTALFTIRLTYPQGNPDTCGTTSIGKGLNFAGDEFGNPATFRQESLWVVILLTDGATNGPSYVCPTYNLEQPLLP